VNEIWIIVVLWRRIKGRLRKYFEGSGQGLIAVIFGHFMEELRKTTKKLRMAGVPAEIRTYHLIIQVKSVTANPFRLVSWLVRLVVAQVGTHISDVFSRRDFKFPTGSKHSRGCYSAHQVLTLLSICEDAGIKKKAYCS
jgi:hypothetical protein